MQELSMDDIDEVSGGRRHLEMGEALDIIGGIAGVCAAIPGLQGAAAFAGGVFLIGKVCMAMT